MEEEEASNDTEFPLTKRVAELESLLKKYQDDLALTKHRLILERSQKTTEPSNERVLEFKRSPSRIIEESRSQELHRLRQENRELLAELQNVQNEGYSDAADAGGKRKRGDGSSPELETIRVPNSTLDNFRADIRELHDTVAQKEKRIERLHLVSRSYYKKLGC